MSVSTLISPAPAASSRRRKGTLQYSAAGLALLFFYLLWGDFVMQMMEMVVPRIMPLQLKQLGASNTVIGLLVTSLPSLFNMTMNPVVSLHSDNYRSSWGRRVPYLLVMTPLVTLALVLLAFAPEISRFLQWHLPAGISSKAVGIGTIAVLLAIFQMFHFLMSPLYYYLFVDVVPDAYMGRFMGLFRMVVAIKTYLFNTYIFGHAMTHTRAIYVGCALVYCAGFLWMCFMVKEGEYPPPSHARRPGLLELIRVYGRECYSHRHYLLYNLRNATMVLPAAVGSYIIFVQRDELGMSLSFIGKVSGWTSLISLVLCYPFGMLADRYKPIRVLLVAMALQLPLPLLCFLYLRGSTSFIVLTLVSLTIFNVAQAAEGPFQATIPPRERYGQFGAANQVIVGLMQIIGGFVAGWFLDLLTRNGEVVANYRYLYLWNFFWHGVSLVAMILLYRSWRSLGGPDNYVPPGRRQEKPETMEVTQL